jgi:GNAT superfamily N-acetyltransferase
MHVIWVHAAPPDRRPPRRPPVNVRRAQPEDAAALSRLHGDAGADYAALSPAELRPRDLDGAVLRLVADVDGEVAGALVAHVVPPDDAAGQEGHADAAHTRLRIDSVVTAEAHRGRGYAAQLVEAAETWGRERGATVAETWTSRSLAFWKGRLAYAERSVNLRKPLR